MNRKTILRALCAAAALLLAVCLIVCVGSAKYSVKIAVALPEIAEGAEAELRAAIGEGLPELNTPERKPLVRTFEISGVKDRPTSLSYHLTTAATMYITNEIEILICDAVNAQCHSDGGSAYMPLDELFTAEEQAELGIVPLTVSKVNQDGSATGESSSPVGLSLEACEGVKDLFGRSDLGLYVIAAPGTEANIENVRAAVRYILSM